MTAVDEPTPGGSLTRRRLIGTGVGAGLGAATVAGLGAVGTGASARPVPRQVVPEPGVLDLYVNDGYVAMVDESLVYMRGFGDRPTERDDPAASLTVEPRVFLTDGRLATSRTYPVHAEHPHDGRPEPLEKDPTSAGNYRIRRAHWASFFPARTVIAETGTDVRIRVHNRLRQVHELEVGGLGTTGPIPPGGTGVVRFTPTVPGTYLYQDPSRGPVERVLGLHGVFLVVPRDDRWRLTPGGAEFERQWVWLCQDVEPDWARTAAAGRAVDPDVRRAVPRYFMLNDRSGFAAIAATSDEDANHKAHEESLIAGAPRLTDVRDFSKSDTPGSVTTGQLVRMVNAGLVIHQMHFHGNHVWTLRRNGQDFPRRGGHLDEEGHVVLQQFEDVVELDPLDRKEIMLPLRRPPEALDRVWAARREDWHYPMHCHAEPSQSAAGGLYPGGLMADWTLTYPEPDDRSPQHHLYASQVEFALNQPREGSPETLFRQRPDRVFERAFYNRRHTFPDGAEHEIWAFRDERGNKPFPSPPIRVTEGEVVHLEIKPGKGPHTIHLHGLEPDPRNDGVGHTSFEVTGGYTYQWRPQPGEPGNPNVGSAGTYFYHCHVNTVLHVQMGMFGPIIVDPVVHPDYPVEPGARRAFVDGPLYDLATEMLLVPYSVDPRWHELNHAAGLSGEDVGLNRFEPEHFYILGGTIAAGGPREGVWSASECRINVSGRGHPTLLRVNNANYFPTRMRFTTEDGRPAPIADLIGHDGRPFRNTFDPSGPSPVAQPGTLVADQLAFGSAERYMMLLRPPSPGVYLLHVDWSDWRVDGGPPLARRTVRLVAS